jgi:hypothetical protein
MNLRNQRGGFDNDDREDTLALRLRIAPVLPICTAPNGSRLSSAIVLKCSKQSVQALGGRAAFVSWWKRNG